MNTKTQNEKIVDSVSRFRKVLAEINSADEALHKGLSENRSKVLDRVERLMAILSNDDYSLGGEELLAWRQECEGFIPMIKCGDEYITRLAILIGEVCASDYFEDQRHNENFRRILAIAMWACLKGLNKDPLCKLNCYRRLLDADRHYMPYDSCDLLENDISLDALADERYWTVCAESPEHFDAINAFAEEIISKMKQKGINLNAGNEEFPRSIKDIAKQDSAFLLDLRVLELCADLLKELEDEYAEQKSVFAEKYELEREEDVKAIQAARAEALLGFQQVFLRAHPSFKGEPGSVQEEFKKGKAEAEAEYDKKIEDCRRKENPYRAEKGGVCAEWRRIDWNSALKDFPQDVD